MDFHHGYLLVGDKKSARGEAENMAVSILSIEKKGLVSHPDFFDFKNDKLGINEARDIRKHSSKKSFFGRGIVFMVETNHFTREAANALLKTFEEPRGKSYFLIVTSSVENIPVTLRSRLLLLKFPLKKDLDEKLREIVLNFLKTPTNKRWNFVEKNIESGGKEKVLDFLGGVEFVLTENLRKEPLNKELVFALCQIGEQRKKILMTGASFKLIMEHFGFVMPKI